MAWRYKILKQDKLDQLLKEQPFDSLILEITHQSKPGYHLIQLTATGRTILGRLSKSQFDKLNPVASEHESQFININNWKIDPLLNPAVELKLITEFINKHLTISHSNGLGKNGKRYWFVSVNVPVVNPDVTRGCRPRRIGGFTTEDLQSELKRLVKKWYFPMKYFFITDGEKKFWVGANSEDNALKEYWRYGDVKDSGKRYPIDEFLSVANAISMTSDII